MTVLSVAYPLFPVHPDSSGGAEQILSSLDGALTERGHRSIVIAAEGSSVEGTLVPTASATGMMNDGARAIAQNEHASIIQNVLRRVPIDLVHYHGLDFPAYIVKSAVPSLATIHLPLDWYPSSPLHTHAKPVCVSSTQASDHDCVLIPNGVDTERFRPAGAIENYLLWIGRICPEKGPHVALQIAHRLRMPIKLAGPVHQFESHLKYFEDQVKPLLDQQRQYLGAVEGSSKVALLQGARALLVPSFAPETSSLVAMEALSCGTPVVAFQSGALPEIVTNGETGFIVRDESGMSDSVLRIDEISRTECRAIATMRFDHRVMADRYLTLYEAMLAHSVAGAT